MMARYWAALHAAQHLALAQVIITMQTLYKTLCTSCDIQRKMILQTGSRYIIQTWVSCSNTSLCLCWTSLQAWSADHFSCTTVTLCSVNTFDVCLWDELNSSTRTSWQTYKHGINLWFVQCNLWSRNSAQYTLQSRQICIHTLQTVCVCWHDELLKVHCTVIIFWHPRC